MDSYIRLAFEVQSIEFGEVQTEDYPKWILLIVMLLGDWACFLCTTADVCSEMFGVGAWDVDLEVGKILNAKFHHMVIILFPSWL